MTIFKPEGAGSWRNSDGLIVYFGPLEGTAGNGGEYKTFGPARTQEFIIDMNTLTTSAQYIDQHWELPKGALIESVELNTLVVCTSSGSGTFSVGLKGSDQVTNVADTSLLNAETFAVVSPLGTKVTYTAPVAGTDGTSIGTNLAVNGLITAKVSAVYQTGRVSLRVNYSFLPVT